MQKYICLAATILLVAIIAFGCSNGSSPTAPALRDNLAPRDSSGIGQTGLVGLWQVAIDLNSQTIEAVPARTSDLMLNVLGFMEPPALDKMTIDFDTLVIDFENTAVEVDVIFTHPLVTPENAFQGFDVRGIVFGPTMLNADGYTAVMNPADFADVPFGYFDGLLGAPNSYANYDADYWPYKYFCDDLDATTELWDFYFNHADIAAHRGMFSEGETLTRHYDLSWLGLETPLDFLVFNYAVYANFEWAVGETPFTNDDFPTTANSAEAFCMSYDVVDNSLSYSGSVGSGEISLDIRIWDWQGLESTEVTIESVETGVIAPVMNDTFGPGSDPFDGIVAFVDVPGVPTSVGDLDILITATDTGTTYGDAWFFGLLPPEHDYYDLPVENYWIIPVTVGEEPPCMEEPVDIEIAPYNGTWLDPCDEDTACAYEVSTVGSTLEWTHDAVGTFWNSGATAGVYDNDMDTMLIGPEILIPSTGALEISYHFDFDGDGTGTDWMEFGFFINGVYTGAWSMNYDTTDHYAGYKIGNKTPGDIFQGTLTFTSDDTGGNVGEGCTVWDVTTDVFDPGTIPVVYPGGPPDPNNSICSDPGASVITAWTLWGPYPPPYQPYYANYYWTTLDFKYGGGTGDFYSWCIGGSGWMMPHYTTGTVWISGAAHRECAPGTNDGFWPFGDFAVTSAENTQIGSYFAGWGSDPAGEVRYMLKDDGTATERFIIEYCDVGQIGEADTCNWRVIMNGTLNTNPYDMRVEYVDVGSHAAETSTDHTGGFMIWNGQYIELQCDYTIWSTFQGTSLDIDQPDY